MFARILFPFLLLVLATHAVAHAGTRIMVFGDSLSAGYKLPADDGFVPALQRHLRGLGADVEVRNASVSGSTTADGVSRLAHALRKWEPDMVILQLGANDALRAFNPKVTQANLDAMLGQILERKIAVLLAGMYAPRNLGERYGSQFNAIYPGLAEKHGVPLYPFFLEGVALDPRLNLDDAVHPNAEGVRVIVSGIAPHVMGVLGALQ